VRTIVPALRPILSLFAGAVLAGALVPLPAAAQSQAQASPTTCVAMFRQYDVLENLYPNNRQRYANRVAPAPVVAQAQVIRNAGCITLTRELAPMATLRPAPVVDGGRRITPTRLHVGVVTNMADDAATQAFFQASGVSARSIGSAPLGRRIYVGPFATEGALDAASALAVTAGFASPYPGHM